MNVYENIKSERLYQDNRWGVRNQENEKWLSILVEEIGEVAQAMLEGENLKVREELIQVAAVAVAWLECIERRRADE